MTFIQYFLRDYYGGTAFLALHRFPWGARSGGTTVPFSGTSPPHQSRQKTELGALGPASGSRPANGTGVRGRGERPEAFREDSCPSDARLVARGGGAGGCGAWWLRTPSTLRPRRPQLPAPPARRWVWSTRWGVRGAGGELGGGRRGGSPRAPAAAHLVKARSSIEGWPWVGWCHTYSPPRPQPSSQPGLG